MSIKPKVKRVPIRLPAETTVNGRAAAVKELLSENFTKTAYEKGMNVSRFCETLDPSKDHQNSDMDAFNRVLRACGIRTRSVPESGVSASTLEDVVRHPKARHLAIELIARAYRGVATNNRSLITSLEGAAGSMINKYTYPNLPRGVMLQPAIPLTEVIGQTTGINARYYKPFYLSDVEKATSRVGEGAEIPAVRISTSEKIVNLVKYGRRIDVTYESLRAIPIDLLSFYVQRIAVKVETEKVDKVVKTAIEGDGNPLTQATSYNLSDLDPAAAGKLTLRAWLAFKMKFKNPYMLTTILGNDAPILDLMLLSSGTANFPLVMMASIFSQQAVTPINRGMDSGVRAGWLDVVAAGKLLGIDQRLSIERVFEIGGTIQEMDKDVKEQIDSLVLTEVEGYVVLEQQANKLLNLLA